MGEMTVDLTRIQQIMSNGNYDEARPLLKEYLAGNPNDPLALRLYGNTFAYTGFLGKAKKIWHDALRKFPENADLIYNYALAHYLQGNLYLARTYWKKALKLNPEDSEVYFNLGQVARDEGRLHSAIKWWKDALKYKHDNVEVMNNIGVAYATLRSFGKAAIWYKKAVRVDKNYALAHFNLANALFETGEYADAQKHAEVAAKLDPSSHLETVTILARKIKDHLAGKEPQKIS
ncbi:MAG TPA: tetratricopeptide repeat protein [Candidatus Rifleibacterium sp.]|nr:tetratricopeptide repeat protein [Candidatus Rifleibacterium sp.]HPT45018.1 tetratricopeptide repeat protein [Candidatus Rifleibacterium sp.]